MEMTLKVFAEATKIPDSFPKGRVIKSTHDKTSFLYREREVSIAEEIYQSVLYRDYLRPLLLSDNKLKESER